jgi:putative ABC transport system permease protein
MARRRPDRWLLLRLAAQNVGRRRWRTLLLGLSVTLGVGVGFAGFVAGWALRTGMTANLSRMGADLVVVPAGTLVNITASLLTVQPTEQTLDIGLAEQLATVAGVAHVAPQRIVPMLVDGRPANVVAFDPARDFSVQGWLDEQAPGAFSSDSVILGGRLDGRLGQQILLCGRPVSVYGRLGKTGVGPFDDSYFLSFDGLTAVVAFCRSSPRGRPVATLQESDGKACAPNLPPNRASAFLLQFAAGADPTRVKFELGQLPGVRIVEGNTVLTSTRLALSLLLIGVGLFASFQLAATLILVALLFSAIVRERHREIGLLRAMGARPLQVTAVILGEAAIVTGMGGLAGLIFGASLLLLFDRSLGFWFAMLGIPFSWPPAGVLRASAAVAVLVSALLGLLGAFVPAWRVRRMPPYALIQPEAPG